MLIVGHRGFPSAEPENTIKSFQAAWEAGAHWVELDVRLTADRQLAVTHDAVFKPAGAPVKNLTLAEINRRRPAGAHVPVLQDVLDALPAGLGVNVEVKAAEAAGSAARAAAASGREALLSSFDAGTLAACRQAAPDVPRGLLIGGWPRDVIAGLAPGRRLKSAGASVLIAERKLLPAASRSARSAGTALWAWNINSLGGLQAARRAGAAAVITDQPDLLAAALA